MLLRQLAYARSGDKGAGANIGVIARSPAAYDFLRGYLTAERVESFFRPMAPGRVTRYELPNLLALNFVLPAILDGGGSLTLRIDAQGKTLGQALLEMEIEKAPPEGSGEPASAGGHTAPPSNDRPAGTRPRDPLDRG